MIFYVSIDQQYMDLLGELRTRPNLKLAIDKELCWLSGFNEEDVQSKLIQGIPTKKIYAEKNGMLFLWKSLLPSRHIPDVLWTPIDRALRIESPSYNENYFGLKEDIVVKIVPSELYNPPTAMLVELDLLEKYLIDAPAIRLTKIKWTVVNGNSALLLGTPLLPLKGNTYWKSGVHFLPEGFDFELHSLNRSIEKKLSSEDATLLFWSEDGTYQIISADDFASLSRSSFRLTIEKLGVGNG